MQHTFTICVNKVFNLLDFHWILSLRSQYTSCKETLPGNTVSKTGDGGAISRIIGPERHSGGDSSLNGQP